MRVYINLVPKVIYKHENRTDKWWTSGGKGWVANKGFVTWLCHFVDFVKPTKEETVVLILVCLHVIPTASNCIDNG